jgi:transcriptional regulator with GAF, ATPase, and Fis domain
MKMSEIHPDEMPKFVAFTNKVFNFGHGWTNELTCLTNSGETLSAEISASILTVNRQKLMIGLVRDITERKIIQETLMHRLKMEELVSSISTYLLHLNPAKIEIGLDVVLKKLGEFSGVDRCYIYRLNQSKAFINTNEWTREGIKPMMKIQNEQDKENFRSVFDELHQFNVVHISNVDELTSDKESLKKALEGMGIKSTLSVPMRFGNRLVGFCGFESFQEYKEWDERDIMILQVIGDILVNTLERKNIEEDLNKASRQIELIKGKFNEELEAYLKDYEELSSSKESVDELSSSQLLQLKYAFNNVKGNLDKVLHEGVQGEELPSIGEIRKSLEKISQLLKIS